MKKVALCLTVSASELDPQGGKSPAFALAGGKALLGANSSRKFHPS